jgi:hypothetical protein
MHPVSSRARVDLATRAEERQFHCERLVSLVGRVTACPERSRMGARRSHHFPPVCRGLPALPSRVCCLVERVTLPTHCHVRHGGFVLWRIERSETSLVYFC